MRLPIVFEMLKMFNVPAVFRQFIAIFCCKFNILEIEASFHLLIFGIGLTMPFTFSMLYGWPLINLIDLQDANSTLPMGSLSVHETTLVISILNAGALIGNFGVVPIIYMIGPKKTIHMFSIPIIVSRKTTLWNQ